MFISLWAQRWRARPESNRRLRLRRPRSCALNDVPEMEPPPRLALDLFRATRAVPRCLGIRGTDGIPCGFCPRFSWVKTKNPS